MRMYYLDSKKSQSEFTKWLWDHFKIYCYFHDNIISFIINNITFVYDLYTAKFILNNMNLFNEYINSKNLSFFQNTHDGSLIFQLKSERYTIFRLGYEDKYTDFLPVFKNLCAR